MGAAAVKFSDAIEQYVVDMFAQGRFTSPRTEVSYRAALNRLADVVQNRDPRAINRNDVKRALAHWRNPNSQRTNRAIFVSFFDYQMEEGVRKDNPARQTRRPRRRPTEVYRLTRDEALRMLLAAKGRREQRCIYLGICAGLRLQELRGLRGIHFRREGWIWVSSDIAKGSRERWVPVIEDLEPIVAEIQRNLADDEYVLCKQRWRDPGINKDRADYRTFPTSKQAIYYLVQRVGRAAGIAAPISPHLMRHAFGDHVARFSGIRNAQFLLGHAGVGTTEIYLGNPTLDELARSVKGFGYQATPEPVFSPLARGPVSPPVVLSRPEPVLYAGLVIERLRRAYTGSTLAIGRPC